MSEPAQVSGDVETRGLIAAAPPQPWTYIVARTLLHVESSIDSAAPGTPVCSIPKSRRSLAAFVTEVGSITEEEWRAIREALNFTAANNAAGVSDAHVRVADRVARILGTARG